MNKEKEKETPEYRDLVFDASFNSDFDLNENDIWRLVDIINFPKMCYECMFGLILGLTDVGLRFVKLILNFEEERKTITDCEIDLIKKLERNETTIKYIYTPVEFLKPLRIDVDRNSFSDILNEYYRQQQG